MACCLTPSTSATEDFHGDEGCKVTLTLKGPKGAGAEILHIRYAGSEIDTEAPYQFTIKSGRRFLIVLVDCSKPGVVVQLVEKCNDEQVIDRFNFDPRNPARGYIILGE
jgi:hypothetical protein